MSRSVKSTAGAMRTIPAGATSGAVSMSCRAASKAIQPPMDEPTRTGRSWRELLDHRQRIFEPAGNRAVLESAARCRGRDNRSGGRRDRPGPPTRPRVSAFVERMSDL